MNLKGVENDYSITAFHFCKCNYNNASEKRIDEY